MEARKVGTSCSASKDFIVITSCSASKCGSVPITGPKVVDPSHYLSDATLISKLKDIRQQILRHPEACVGTRKTYAFDLYVKAGRAYRDLRVSSNYIKLKSMLLSNGIEWFFLSGGYGIIHALEESRKYQATFDKNIACQNCIPFTGDLWKGVLNLICDDIVSKFNPGRIYVFGSKDYTNFIQQTNFWKNKTVSVKMFESTGSSGPLWLSPILNDLADAIVARNLVQFDQKYPKNSYKQ